MSHRILVVDDDPLVLRSVERSLRRAGFEVHGAKSTADALSVARGGDLDLALVDFALGREDGLELLGRLREEFPACLRVLMTGNRDFPVVVEAVNRGEVVRVLNKPFQPSELVALVTGAIDAGKQRDQRVTARLIEGAMGDRRVLDTCLRRRQVKLAIQPIVAVANNVPTVVAYEALLRPQNTAFADATELLLVAERAGRLADLGRVVFELAADWLEVIPDHQRLFVNIHPTQLGDPAELTRSLRPVLAQSARVVLEITERASIYDTPGWEESAAYITEAGFSIAVDDLGAGYNSLTMLADLAPRYVKIDMNLVRGIHEDARKRRLVHLLATFADATHTLAVAEGVEVVEESLALQEIGVTLLQGHLFGRPAFELR